MARETAEAARIWQQRFAAKGLRDRVAEFAGRGATVIAAIAGVQSLYPLAERLVVARGRDPDRPPLLSKVTETL